MIDKTNKSGKVFITEEDIATLLQRYTATTLLTLLQEVARSAAPKIDWDELVKKTSTGITNAREYQMLWRHLAYRDSLLPVQDGAELLDDDSDLEYELEAFPHVSGEASMEAAAHVKVMVSSYLPSESDIPNSSTVEAPLTINIPNGPSHRGCQGQSQSSWSTRGVNITVPVSLQTPNEGSNGNGSASGSMARKKRKKWSSDEDQELIAAVEKCGEGNWANILKGDFKGDRTASQLSQRWALIRKKRDTSNSGLNQSGLQRTEVQMAANHALSLAVGHRAPSKNLTIGTTGTSSNSTSVSTAEASVSGSGSLQVQHQSQPSPVQTSIQAGTLSSVPKSRVIAKKSTLVNPNLRSDPIATANTVAAAACMAGPSGFASVPKAETVKSAVAALHVPSGGSSPKPLSNNSLVMASGSEGAVSKHAPSTSASASTMSSDKINALTSSAAAEFPSKPKVESAEESEVSDSDNTPKEQAREDGVSFLVIERQGEKALTNAEMGVENQVATPAEYTVVKCDVGDALENGSKYGQNADESKMIGSRVNGSGNKSDDAKEKMNKQEDETTMVTNGYSKNPEVVIKPKCLSGM